MRPTSGASVSSNAPPALMRSGRAAASVASTLSTVVASRSARPPVTAVGAPVDCYGATVDRFARLFVMPQTGHGLSGTSYEARDPLGRFLRASAPLEPLVRVSAARHSIVGIPADRSLLRSSDGAASFTRVGPAQVAFADVELSNDGTGLALSIPEAIWLTRDEGASWTRLPAASRSSDGRARPSLFA